jgi:hypothetical protein
LFTKIIYAHGTKSKQHKKERKEKIKNFLEIPVKIITFSVLVGIISDLE